jgi:hypothetical protein
MNTLAGWENFYVIVGSSAGALIGLQFVVITLIADRAVGPGQAQAGAAFATPTIVHFSAVLLLAAIVSAPWESLTSAADSWGVLGLVGVVYEIIVWRRMRRQTAYRPLLEDWLFHLVFPLIAYTILGVSAYFAVTYSHSAMFAVAGSALALLFIGIHNAWDAVTYHVFFTRHKDQKTDLTP